MFRGRKLNVNSEVNSITFRMNSIKKRKNTNSGGFKSYLTDGDTFEERPIDVPEEPVVEKVSPFLFKDEIVLATANNVLKLSPFKKSGSGSGISGSLFITNFKVSFVTTLDGSDDLEVELYEKCLQSDFLGINDFSLSEIDTIYQTFDGETRKKKLFYNSRFSDKIQGLQIILKNLRVITFSFKFTPQNEDISIGKTLLFYAYPHNIDHLYLSSGITPSLHSIIEFRTLQDWEKELKRTNCPNWRVSMQNEFYHLCSTLPNSIVIPRDLLDVDLERISHKFNGNRPPVWCWGLPTGAALIRMPQLSQSVDDGTKKEDLIKKLFENCHPQKRNLPIVLDLDEKLPALREIYVAYSKLKDLHTPDNPNQYKLFQCQYLSRFESSRWLEYVSKFLTVASNVVTLIHMNNMSVILQEYLGRDTSAVISCIVQVLLDPFARTLKGFHQLIQKEWIALGHPFTQRIGYLRNEENQSPLWLLFLDCIYQIMMQKPKAMEFSKDYLVTLWQSAHCSLYPTFMFDSIYAKVAAISVIKKETKQDGVHMWPIWCWWSQNTCQLQLLMAKDEDKEVNNSSRASTTESNDLTNCSNSADSLDLDRHKQIRCKVKRSFINVNYVQALIESISNNLSRINDPVSNTYHIWKKIETIMSGNYQLFSPKDMNSSLWMDRTPLDVDTRPQYMQPWNNCFGYWLTEASSLSKGKPSRYQISVDFDQITTQWQCLEEMYVVLKDFLAHHNQTIMYK